MDTRTKMLIAVGAAFTANCQPCLEHLAQEARDSWTEEKEIQEAIASGDGQKRCNVQDGGVRFNLSRKCKSRYKHLEERVQLQLKDWPSEHITQDGLNSTHKSSCGRCIV